LGTKVTNLLKIGREKKGSIVCARFRGYGGRKIIAVFTPEGIRREFARLDC
jgi:hypothetical protein